MKKNGFVTILVIIIFAVIGIVSAYYFGTKKGNILPITTQTPSSIATNSPTQTTSAIKSTTSPTANWKTYTNNTYDFVIKYPKTLG